MTYLVEVDVHALELELGGAIVDTVAVEAVLARDGLPKIEVSIDVASAFSRIGLPTRVLTHQKAAPIWLPYKLSVVFQHRESGSSYLRTDRSGGEPVQIRDAG